MNAPGTTSRGRRDGPCRPRGLTLVELVLGLAITTILLGSMVASVSVASRALTSQAGPVARAISAADVVGQINADLAAATGFLERTDTAVTFTVPDRNGDGVQEIMRYWLDGPRLMRRLNTGPAATLAEDVRHFRLTYLHRAPAPEAATAGAETARGQTRTRGRGHPHGWPVPVRWGHYRKGGP